jgi:cytochrome c551/c552
MVINNLKINIGRLFLMMLLLLAPLSIFAQDGKALFDANCKQCHAINDVVIGPALKDIEKRRSEEWLIKWIKGSQAMVKAGDPAAVEVFNKYNKVVMPNQNVNDAEIKAILTWIKEEGSKVPVAKIPTPGAPGAEEKDNTLWWVLGSILLFLSLVAILNKVKSGLEYAIREKTGVPHPIPMEPKKARKIWIRGNKKLIAVVLLLLVVFGSVKGWYGLKSLGVSTNYEPDQPIHFSHKLHAGDNKIACLYCHSGADKSRHANIPSASLCMNCHKYVKEGPMYGDQEIKKIYAALDWDGVNYGTNQKPLQWIRVHNLPALAYFNHAQHVTVGKVECQTCHGPIQEMEVVKQFSPLTMGWCINCHRETEVKMDGNGYYDELHKTLAAKYGADAKLTVDKIGGIECARCHY